MDERGPTGPRRSLIGPRLIALILVLGGAFLFSEALRIGSVRGYQVVGPSTLPLVVSAALAILGVALAIRTTVLPDVDLAERVAEEEASSHWPTTGALLGLLVIYALALNGFRLGTLEVPGLGFVVATTLFLPAAARILGSRNLVRDVTVGLVLAVVVYFGFTEFLGVRLPAGVLDLLG